MAQPVSIIVTPDDRVRLAAVIGDRNSPLKHIQRARIVFLSSERLPVLDIVKRIGLSRPAVWRWQVRHAEQGVDGLLRDKTRKPGKAPVSLETVAQVLALPCSNPSGNATHWITLTVDIPGASRRKLRKNPPSGCNPPLSSPDHDSQGLMIVSPQS